MMTKLFAMLLLAAVLTLAAAPAFAADFGAINGVWTGIVREEDSFDYYVLSVRNNDAALFTVYKHYGGWSQYELTLGYVDDPVHGELCVGYGFIQDYEMKYYHFVVLTVNDDGTLTLSSDEYGLKSLTLTKMTE